jgi:hypothetical protein
MEMSRIETSLAHLEARLRSAFEGDISRGGIPRKLHSQLLKALLQSMQENVKNGYPGSDVSGNTSIAPDIYTIVLPIYQANILINHPAGLDALAQKMEKSATQARFRLAGPPMLRVVADPNVEQFYIKADYSHLWMGDSYTTEMEGKQLTKGIRMDEKVPSAFLIINGLSTFQLTQPVINIGCDHANHLVLEDPNISQLHAQLRWISDHFVIFDLESKLGTFVNGTAVSSHVLHPGDVILLGGVPLVYGQETSYEIGYTREMPADPPAPEVL